MYLTQLLLPLPGGRAKKASRRSFLQVRKELTARFGGVTAYVHSPAEGDWMNKGKRAHDAVVVIEVMSKARDRTWWRNYRKELEERLAQESIVVRTATVSTNR